jgi:hypothetical protein
VLTVFGQVLGSIPTVNASAAGVGRWPIPFRIFTVESGSNTYAVKKDNFILQDPSKSYPAYNAAAVQDSSLLIAETRKHGRLT